MKFTSFPNTVRTLGLIGMLAAIEGMSMVNPAQAQAKRQTGSVCSAAYFDHPGYMYNPVTEEQRKAVDRFNADPVRVKKFESITAAVKTFSVPLDSPIGYVVKKVNGKPIAIPPKIEQAINRAVNDVAPSPNNRKRVAELNQRYGRYATFGQNVTLILSPEQSKEYNQLIYESLAYIASVMTPEQRRAERDERIAMGECSDGALYKPDTVTLTIDTGERPDLDKMVREDKTGRTLFKL